MSQSFIHQGTISDEWYFERSWVCNFLVAILYSSRNNFRPILDTSGGGRSSQKVAILYSSRNNFRPCDAGPGGAFHFRRNPLFIKEQFQTMPAGQIIIDTNHKMSQSFIHQGTISDPDVVQKLLEQKRALVAILYSSRNNFRRDIRAKDWYIYIHTLVAILYSSRNNFRPRNLQVFHSALTNP